jgi:hypothetical protein
MGRPRTLSCGVVLAATLGAVVSWGGTGTAPSPAAGAATARPIGAATLSLPGPGVLYGVTPPGGGPLTGTLKSTNWAGWADSTGTFTSVTASWVEPVVTCPTSGAVSAIWAGLDGLTDGSVEQAGTIAECSGSSASHAVWWEMYPTNAVQIVKNINPGDHITVTVSFASGQFQLKLQDSTNTAGSFTKTESCGAGVTCSRASAEWIVEAPSARSGILPLADFGKATVTGAAASTNKTSGAIDKPAFGAEKLVMVSQAGPATLASTSRLKSTGTAFAVTWHQAS